MKSKTVPAAKIRCPSCKRLFKVINARHAVDCSSQAPALDGPPRATIVTGAAR